MGKMLFLGKSVVLFQLSILLCLSIDVQSQECPAGQVKHTWKNKSGCCDPVFNCPKDHQIIPCTESNTVADVCSSCEAGKNYHVTSSIDSDWMKYRCFQIEPRHSRCSPEDHLPFHDTSPNCAMYCECDQAKCAYGIPCGCVEVSNCGQNEELNTVTGKCEPCRPHTYKHEIGCQPCTWNKTSWRLSFHLKVSKSENPQSPGVTVSSSVAPGVKVTTKDIGYKIPETPKDKATSQTEQGTNNIVESGKTNDEGGAPVVLIVAVIVILVVAALLVACFLVIKRKIKEGNQDDRLVILYKKLPCVNSNLSIARAEERVVDEENGEGGEQPKSACRTLAVKPMLHENGNHPANGGIENGRPANGGTETYEPVDTIRYTDLPMAVTGDDSCTPLMSTEDSSAAATDVKSV